MREFEKIGEDLFNKIRGRFPKVTIGDADGNVTNEPSAARFFDFDYNGLGKVSVSINEDDGLTVIYSKDFMENQDEITRSNWYDFLKELRVFSKKRMLDYSVRDITKSNLDKRDYKFLAKRPGEETMAESKLYGTSKISYQNVDSARLVIKHTESINQELAAGRTRSIGAIYIESADGERFKYPYKHLSGARAMARHVAEGGKPFDDFGTHITGLSEEMAKLRKFKNYMGRSAVMAESLAGYMDAVYERISTVKKTIESLQKPNYYKESFAAFEKPMLEDVPSDVAENWIDQLTIKQFNEELADVFPYIYKLVSEVTKAKELGPDDLIDESGLQYYTGKKKYGKEGMAALAKAGREGASEEELGAIKDKYKKTKEEFELEQAFEDTMGQFADHVCEDCGNPSWRTLDEEKQKGVDGKVCWKGYKRMGTKMKGGKRVDNCVKVKEDDLDEAYIKTRDDAVEALARLRGIGKKIETGRETYDGNLANEYVSDVYDVYNWMDARLGISGMNEPKLKRVLDDVMQLRGEAKKLETKSGSGENARFGNQIVNALYPLIVYIRDIMEIPKEEDDDGKDEEEQKTPLGEFILSYFDRDSGQFPKGETAVLTMVEKDYGEQFIEPAKQFIEQVAAKFEEFQMRDHPQQMEKAPDALSKAVGAASGAVTGIGGALLGNMFAPLIGGVAGGIGGAIGGYKAGAAITDAVWDDVAKMFGGEQKAEAAGIAHAKAAKAGEESFEFDGKEYPVTLKPTEVGKAVEELKAVKETSLHRQEQNRLRELAGVR